MKMEKLDIDWLHREHKVGRRSGRTTEMLAEVVGNIQLSEPGTSIHIAVHRLDYAKDLSSKLVELAEAIGEKNIKIKPLEVIFENNVSVKFVHKDDKNRLRGARICMFDHYADLF